MPRLPAALALCAAAAVAASPARAGTVWLCGLSDDLTRIVCVADQPLADDAAPPPTTARVRGTSFPLDPRRQWTVDLWSPATDPGPVAQLAQATLCYRSPGCEVVMNTAVLERGLPLRATRR
jgi:hypothetical protein